MSKTVRRIPKSFRMLEEDSELVRVIYEQLRRFPTEADVLAEAAQLGIFLLLAEIYASQEEPLPDIDRSTVARLLRTRLLPTMEFLVQEQALPTMLYQHLTSAADPAGSSADAAPHVVDTRAEPAPPLIDPNAAGDIAAFGGQFLDFDDE